MSGTPRPSYAVSPGPDPRSLYCGTPSPKIRMLLLPFKAADLPPAPGLLPSMAVGSKEI